MCYIHPSSGENKLIIPSNFSFRKTINVTLWDAFAEAFEKDYMKENLEQPVIVIIASGRVTKFRGQALFLAHTVEKFLFKKIIYHF